MSTPRLRSNLEIVNGSSRVQLHADPRPDMLAIQAIATTCLRHHETLALSTWRTSVSAIRAALENIEDIYEKASEA